MVVSTIWRHGPGPYTGHGSAAKAASTPSGTYHGRAVTVSVGVPEAVPVRMPAVPVATTTVPAPSQAAQLTEESVRLQVTPDNGVTDGWVYLSYIGQGRRGSLGRVRLLKDEWTRRLRTAVAVPILSRRRRVRWHCHMGSHCQQAMTDRH
jgi:hypothetical protein